MAEQSDLFEKRPDGLLFFLRDHVRAMDRWNSLTKVEIELWRHETLLPPELGNLNSGAFRTRLAKTAKDAFRAKEVPNIEEDLGRVALALRSKETPDEKHGKGKTRYDILREMMGSRQWSSSSGMYSRRMGRLSP